MRIFKVEDVSRKWLVDLDLGEAGRAVITLDLVGQPVTADHMVRKEQTRFMFLRAFGKNEPSDLAAAPSCFGE